MAVLRILKTTSWMKLLLDVVEAVGVVTTFLKRCVNFVLLISPVSYCIVC